MATTRLPASEPRSFYHVEVTRHPRTGMFETRLFRQGQPFDLCAAASYCRDTALEEVSEDVPRGMTVSIHEIRS